MTKHIVEIVNSNKRKVIRLRDYMNNTSKPVGKRLYSIPDAINEIIKNYKEGGKRWDY